MFFECNLLGDMELQNCDLVTKTLYGLLVFRVLLFSVGQRVEHGCCVNIFWTKF